jgi:hypothetical protein
MRRIKMKIIGTFISSALLIISLNAQAQQRLPESEALLDKLRLNKGISGLKDVLYKDITGNPYIFKDFQPGTLVTNDGERYKTSLRYDIYANEMHLKDKDQIFAIFRPEKVKMLETDSIKFIYSEYGKSAEAEVSDGASYFIVKTEGKCKLLVKKNIRIQDAEPPKLYQDTKPAKFIHTTDTYYLKLENKNAVLIRNKKDIPSVLTDQKEALNKFINSNKYGTKRIEDLVEIVDYYNNL